MNDFTGGGMLSSAEMAAARHHTYTLLSRLYHEGVSAETIPYVEAIPTLARHLSQFDDFAATHHGIFRFDIFPYESMFRGTTGLVGGLITEAVGAAWHSSRIMPPSEPDHIGNEMALLAFLAGSEADATVAEKPIVARQMQAKQHELLMNHVLPWLPSFLTALRVNGHPFYVALADLTWEVVAEHMAARPPLTDLNDVLPSAPNILDDERSSIKDIVRFLAIPAYSGLWFGRNTIIKLGRDCNLPRGFGGRIDMEMALFRSAVAYDEVETLLSAIGALAAQWSTHYRAMQTGATHLESFIALWDRRVQDTGNMLARMVQIVTSEPLNGDSQLIREID
ncbi:MAG: molecular chaperone TorD family protein [Anaerolineae bacterium]|nr:molecular chaperone TorD family protein [Anaerolineae bacterium]